MFHKKVLKPLDFLTYFMNLLKNGNHILDLEENRKGFSF